MKQRIVIGCLGLAVRKKNGQVKYLLTQRLAPKSDWHQKWQVAGGGLEFGEHPEQTMIREIKEELDVDPNIIYPFPIIATETRLGKKYHIVLFCYLIDIGKQKINIIDPDQETGDFGWFTLSEAMKLKAISNTYKIIKQADKIIRDNDMLKK
jgi:8-oxo-dGTP diphosphatase